jgi:hypothetical protein
LKPTEKLRMKQKNFPGEFSIKRSIMEFKILPSADVGILEELYYILICFGETARILIANKKNFRGNISKECRVKN